MKSFWPTFIDIWRVFTGHLLKGTTATMYNESNSICFLLPTRFMIVLVYEFEMKCLRHPFPLKKWKKKKKRASTCKQKWVRFFVAVFSRAILPISRNFLPLTLLNFDTTLKPAPITPSFLVPDKLEPVKIL